ncbi:tetratricopeptide repeat protein [Flavobacterium sp. SUN052]|uniref:tetratricopeptide repeat protein n=1 Tax=Flavobacterium sp. SUN052 TaxID=3002441 RepID=UPI00237DEA36|nr:tetratricopeptide repeat protein [Flavobacterium sp. SUN052]MEC4003716.1 tetratricopeptide repeat protein [Flavobacterium sp. SUN052]
MKNIFAFLFCTMSIGFNFAQENPDKSEEIKIDKKKLLAELSESACKCIDSINSFSKSKDSISSEIHNCIDKHVGAYQMGDKLSSIKDLEKTATAGDDGKKEINISININQNSNEYKKYYYEMERYLLTNCKAVKAKIAANDNIGEKSISRNSESLKYYYLGLDESKNENFEKAIEYYKKALVFDKDFAFAYDNIGICYRRLNKFEEAIDAYEQSLKIDPNGKMPLQNIAVVYLYKKEYKKAVKAYEKLAKLDDQNPEVYYGIGNIYTQYLFEYEKALDYLCQAYNLYVAQKSPYRTDAETLIQIVFKEMKKQGKESQFDATLKKYHINGY